MRLKNSNSKNFIANLNGKKVICFGAGTTLIEADFEVLKIEELEDHIVFFVDNDTKKHGLMYEYCNHKYEIKDVESLKQIDVDKYVLLITCAFYVEIYRQLRDIPELRDLDCYMYNAVCSYPDLDVENFFTKEIDKHPYKDWHSILEGLHLKDKHKGQRCFLIGNGPSLTVKDLELLKGEVTFAANRIFKIFNDTSWRPTYYFCIDYLMYGLDHEEVNTVEADLRFVPLERSLAAGRIYDEITYYNRVVNCTAIKDNQIKITNTYDFSYDAVDRIYGGQTVLYDAVQMAVYMGFSEIYLLGVDFTYQKERLEDGTIIDTGCTKDHFNDAYDDGLQNAIAVVFQKSIAEKVFEKAKESCESRGIIIKNATRGGYLEVFERVSLEELINT
ncbi:MAG: DUF115 domain-containing protein [Muribaculum sp.]|nr:DUF115 domain-containing protein [Muribaculum sp.]